jgi:hypothetical protein
MRKIIINIALGIIGSLTANLSLPTQAQKLLDYALEIVGEIFKLLTDDIPDNGKQMVALLDAKKLQIADLGLDVVKEVLADKIKDEAAREGAIKMAEGLEEILRTILSDDESEAKPN